MNTEESNTPQLAEARGIVEAALEDALAALESARAFILKKYGSTNPAREDAIKSVRAALSATLSPVGPMQRCPECHTKFQQVHDVDAHLAMLSPLKSGD